MIQKIKHLKKKLIVSKKKVHFWQRDVINFYFKVNQKRLYVQIKFVELSRRSQIILRLCTALVVLVVSVTYILPVLTEMLADRSYALTAADISLLPDTEPVLQKDIRYNAQSGAYDFQQNTPTSASPKVAQGSQVAGSSNTMIQATMPLNATSGVTVTDPINNVTFTMTPQFSLKNAKQQSSHVYYSLGNGVGQLVYSPEAANVLEDLVLNYSPGNTANFDYNLNLGSNYRAQLDRDGSVGIYGSFISTLGHIATDNPKDASRLQNAQKHAPKTKLLFSIPAPVVRESDRGNSVVAAHYSLLKGGDVLRITATNLSKANYPLDIDPTVTVQSVSQLYRDTNGESNIDFNTSTGDINRGAVTGGVFSDSTGWTTNANNLSTARFLDSAVISNGYAYVAGGATNNTTNNTNSMEYAQISTVNNTIGAWTTMTTNLPASLSQFHLLTYNGYLYVLGGSTTTTGCSTPTDNVYYNPTQPNGAIASTWTTNSTSIPATTGLCSFGAAIYNNTIYVVGGQNGSGITNGQTAVYYASILPNGSIGTWTTSSVSLPVSLWGEDVQIYNGYIYVIGGEHDNAGTLALESTIYKAPLLSGGGIYGTSSAEWTSLPNTFTSTGISNLGGGSFSTVNDGYMYVSGGCTSINTSTFNCNTGAGNVSGTTYIAQINADGSLGVWSAISSSNSDTEVGGSLTVFGGYLYVIAGCTVMNAALSCANTDVLATQKYAQIQSYGQIGPVAGSQTQNDLPGAFSIGVYQEAAVINNGYIYIIGGCLTDNNTSTACQTGTNDVSDAIYYAPINAAGVIGTWNTSADTIDAADGGLAAIDEAAAVYDNYIYVFGGYSYTGGGTNFTNSAAKVVWYAPVSASTGNLTANFAAYGTALAQGSYSMSTVAYNGAVYATGGCTSGATNSAGCSTYFQTGYKLAVGTSGPTSLKTGATCGGGGTSTCVAALTNDGVVGDEVAGCKTIGTGAGKLETLTDCYPGNAAMGIAEYNGYIYLVGGADQGNGESVIIQYGQIDSSGDVPSWSYATTYLPVSSSLGNFHASLRRLAAYAYNDFLYVVGGHDGDTGVVSTSPNIDIGQITLSTGNISSEITSSQVLPQPEWDGAVAFADGTVFVAGGCYNGAPPVGCSTSTSPKNNEVQTFQLYNADNDGTASWTTATNTYSTNIVGASALAYNGYIYVAGGCIAADYTFGTTGGTCTATDTNNNISYAALNPDGTIGSWSNVTLSGGTVFGCLEESNGYLYYMGGETTSGTAAQTAVYYSLIGASGVPGAWSTATHALPISLTQMGCDSFDGTLYVTGGLSGATPTYESSVYFVVPNATGGNISTNNWATITGGGFTNARAGLSTVAAGGYVYIMGGYNGSTFYNDVQFIGINPSTGNSTGSWSYTSAFSYPTSFMSAAIANGYIFLNGGNTATAASTTSCTTTTYETSITSTGQLSPWTQGSNSVDLTNTQMGASAAYYNGYYYVMGGSTCAGAITTNVIQYGGEQSQAMAGFFTRYADLGGNAAPELFLSFVSNAQNDGFNVEYWQLSYITSTQGTNSWGISTAIPNLTSGTVTAVTAYNGSGTDVYLNRYIQIAFTITETKSFTFPDSSPPSVNSYFVYYSPAPQTRLRNGMDFQDEQQQGFDLNY